jgi:TolB-like protein/Tfp pilus assembly protein PilF
LLDNDLFALMKKLLRELRRRRVFRMTAVYIVAAWVALQVGELAFQSWRVPAEALRFVWIGAALGFPVALIFNWIYEITSEGVVQRTSAEPGVSPELSLRRVDYLILSALLAVVAAVAYGLVGEIRGVESPGTRARQSAATNSIAVLPFVNMSSDPEQEYFSDGISEELLNVLAQYPDLRVAARTSSFQFKGENLDIQDIAEKLHVNNVLEGSVRKSGETMRITAQLIKAATGYHLWSETYDRELIDIFAIQDEISASIGNALRIKLALDGGSGKATPTVPVATSTAAFDAYMRGRQLINMRGKHNLEEAVTHLEKALALDETYAPAHAQLAIAITLLSNSPGGYGDFTLEEVGRRAIPHIKRALALDERLAEAYAAQAIFSLVTADYDAVVSNAIRSLELNPSSADALNWLQSGYAGTGQYAEAYETLGRLLAIDPLSIAGRYNRAQKQASLGGQLTAAHAMADSIAEQNPTFSNIAHASISYSAGNSDEALKWSLKAYGLDPQADNTNYVLNWHLGGLGLLSEALRLDSEDHYEAYLTMRMWPELIAVARQWFENDPSDPHSQLSLANALHLSGDIDQAQVLYEELLVLHPDRPIIDGTSGTVVATVRAALGRLRAGDEAGAMDLIELATKDLRQRSRAGFVNAEYYRSAAIIEALKGDNDAALKNLAKAIEAGPREPSLFLEPAFDALGGSPEFQALESRLNSILAAQRGKALQMICFNNPVPDTWQPLAATCEGVAAAGRN